jgi:protein kinase
LGSVNYGAGIDIFAAAVIMAELYLHYPLFPGKNEVDQMQKICAILGTPAQSDWPEGYKLANKINFEFPKCKAKPLGSILKNANKDCLDLLEKMFQFDQNKRITASECLTHPYFQVSIPMTLDATAETFSTHRVPQQQQTYPDSQRERSEDSRKFDLDNNLTRGDRNEELSREAMRDKPIKNTGYYLKKARYRPGVNLASLLTGS